jgi:hypothetical protein
MEENMKIYGDDDPIGKAKKDMEKIIKIIMDILPKWKNKK